jgi:hypothetical protein
VYEMPVKDLKDLKADGNEISLDRAVRCGWRFVVPDTGAVDTIVDYMGIDALGQGVGTGDAGQGVAVIKPGAPAVHFKRAREYARKDFLSSPDEFEARVLDLGNLGMSELWLYNPDPDVADKFYSLSAEEPHMRTADEVLDEIKERVEQQPVRTPTMLTDADDDDLGGA